MMCLCRCLMLYQHIAKGWRNVRPWLTWTGLFCSKLCVMRLKDLSRWGSFLVVDCILWTLLPKMRFWSWQVSIYCPTFGEKRGYCMDQFDSSDHLTEALWIRLANVNVSGGGGSLNHWNKVWKDGIKNIWCCCLSWWIDAFLILFV